MTAYDYAVALAQAWRGERISLGPLQVNVPGPRRIRMSVVAGNRRVHRLIDAAASPGGFVVDVGAHIGYNTVYAANCVGPSGCVIAIEPTDDTRAVLFENVRMNALAQVSVLPCAAGAARSDREFFVRGDTSAVNSLFRDSFYAPVTRATRVQVAPLDDLVAGAPDLVKIDVEGAELDVLAGMTRLLAAPGIRLIVEWHPVLQASAGYAPDALPRALLDAGFTLHASGHVRTRALRARDVPGVTKRLLASRQPLELSAVRPDSRSR